MSPEEDRFSQKKKGPLVLRAVDSVEEWACSPLLSFQTKEFSSTMNYHDAVRRMRDSVQ